MKQTQMKNDENERIKDETTTKTENETEKRK